MATVQTDVYVNKDDLGKNLYRKKTYYRLLIEQDVLAKDQDEADKLFSDNGGIDHTKVSKEITDAKNGVETYVVDANYVDCDKPEFIAKVVYDEYDGLKNAVENGDVELDSYALEDDTIDPATGECMSKPLDDLKDAIYGTKDESDVDVSLNLQADMERGK